ncbi:MAG: ATP-binding protein, partial [Aggregatilineales bacterium]
AAPNQREQLAAALQAIYDGQRTLSLQLAVQRKDGTRFDADIALSRVDNAGDGQAHVVCSVRNISHQKQIERMKDRFVSMVSHELRTPTTSIVLSAHSLRAYYDRMDENKRRAIIERLEEQAIVLADLIEGILDLSHLDSRSQPPASHLVDMSEVMAGAINDLKPAAETKQHLITLRVDYTQKVHVLGNVMDFRRIWRNLISNAVKYTPDHGHITIRLGHLSLQADTAPSCSANISAQSLRLPAGLKPGEYVVGQVEDNGHGIPADQIAQLTTRFYRGWAAQSNIPGTGLGLSLVHELLTLYGGGLSIVSEEGRGSVFSFWLPAAPQEETIS